MTRKVEKWKRDSINKALKEVWAGLNKKDGI